MEHLSRGGTTPGVEEEWHSWEVSADGGRGPQREAADLGEAGLGGLEDFWTRDQGWEGCRTLMPELCLQ